MIRTMAGSLVFSNFLLLIVVVSQMVHTSESLLTRELFQWRALRRSPAGRAEIYMVAKTGGKSISTAEEYSEFVLNPTSPRPMMVFFSAPWCGPCRLSIPVVKDIMKQFAGQIDVAELITDDLPDVAADAGVVSIPTIQMYYNGELLDTIVGCVARNVLASAIDKVLEDTDAEPNGESEEPSRLL